MRHVQWLVLLLFVGGLNGCGGSPYLGVYAASYQSTWSNSSPVPASGTYTDNATVTVTAEGSDKLKLTWQVGDNPPSGTILFQMTGAKGVGVGGSCFEGKLTNGNTQKTCCESCSVTFTAVGFVQSQSGSYTGTTSDGVPYAGTYNGTWTGNRP